MALVYFNAQIIDYINGLNFEHQRGNTFCQSTMPRSILYNGPFLNSAKDAAQFQQRNNAAIRLLVLVLVLVLVVPIVQWSIGAAFGFELLKFKPLQSLYQHIQIEISQIHSTKLGIMIKMY